MIKIFRSVIHEGRRLTVSQTLKQGQYSSFSENVTNRIKKWIDSRVISMVQWYNIYRGKYGRFTKRVW